MTRDQIEADIRKIFTEQFGADAAARLEAKILPFKPIGEANRLADDLDSLDHVEFIMAIEDHFLIEIDDVNARLIRTVDDVVSAVETRISKTLHGAR